jgi:hypothetical protein
VTLAILAGSRPAAPALASDRHSRPRSHRKPRRARRDRGVYSCTHRRSLSRSDCLDLRAPISSSLIPRPNPHSVRCTAAAHLPRFRALALLGRRPPQPVDHLVIPASEKPAHDRKSGALFDRLVGAQDEVRRDIDAHFLRDFQIDDQFEPARLFNGNIARTDPRAILWQFDDPTGETLRSYAARKRSDHPVPPFPATGKLRGGATPWRARSTGCD